MHRASLIALSLLVPVGCGGGASDTAADEAETTSSGAETASAPASTLSAAPLHGEIRGVPVETASVSFQANPSGFWGMTVSGGAMIIAVSLDHPPSASAPISGMSVSAEIYTDTAGANLNATADFTVALELDQEPGACPPPREDGEWGSAGTVSGRVRVDIVDRATGATSYLEGAFVDASIDCPPG